MFQKWHELFDQRSEFPDHVEHLDIILHWDWIKRKKTKGLIEIIDMYFSMLKFSL